MCNEYGQYDGKPMKQAAELYAVAKQLDPTRFVIDTDGIDARFSTEVCGRGLLSGVLPVAWLQPAHGVPIARLSGGFFLLVSP
jgi:hypothetical protein